MATVLVTGVGGAAGVGAVRSLHERTAHDVVGVDMNARAAGLYLADSGHVVPPATDDGWADAVAAVVSEQDVDAVVPTVDEELARLSSVDASLPADVPVIAPRTGVVDVALDKYRTYERLVKAGHDVPRTWLGTERDAVDPSDFPLVVKPRRGRGSRGVRRLDDPSALEAHLDERDADPESILLQSCVEGTEYTTSVVATGDDRLLAVVPKEAITKQGSTVTGVTRRAPTVAESCRSLFDTLAPQGPMNVQQIVDEAGVPHTIEINPRFSSTSCLTVAAGVDEFDLLVRDALGETVAAPDGFQTDLYIQRYQDHVFVTEEEFETPGARLPELV